MTSIAVELIAIALAAVCIWRAQPVHPFSGSIHSDYLSAESGRSLRGILSMIVVLHHLAQKVRGIVLFPLLGKLGYLTVAVFFFLSGFGLMKQYMQKDTYAKKFLLRRLPTILIPYLFATFFYWLLSQFVGTPLTLRDILNELKWGTPVVTASWYIICIALFYIGFRVLMLLCGRHHRWMLPGSILYCGLYILFCLDIGYNSWWYNTTPVLVLGVFWALYEERLNAFFHKNFWKAAPAVIILFVGIYGLKIFLNPRVSSDLVHIPLTWVTAALFACCVLVVTMKVKLRNPILNWLGDLSLETYLCHFLFLTLLRSEILYIENDFLFSILAIACALTFAHFWHKLDSWVLKGWRKLIG